MRQAAALLLLLTLTPAHAQLMSDQEALDRMRQDVRYLASDELEGREAGTRGERMAADRIAQDMAEIGLRPYGDSATFLQAFTFAAQPVLGPKQVFQLGRKRLQAGRQYHPLSFSGNGAVLSTVVRCGYGIHAPELGRDDFAGVDLKGKCAAMAVGSPDGIHPHSKYLAYHDLEGRAAKAVELGASCVLFYNDDKNVDDPDTLLRAKGAPLDVPVVFLKGDLHAELVRDGNPVSLTVEVERPKRTAYNLVGLLDNGRPDVVVIGAHYDHLGMGAEGSLHRGAPAVHNGADDNASGVAVMLQLARDLKAMDQARGNDYLFIAFSGEEKGLFGSNHWTKHPTLPLAELNYMINLDMVGRLKADSTISVNGVGTSPAWAEVERVAAGALKVKGTAGGIGPSDHTSFYLQHIPAIHYFTGTHAQYHKPEDDEALINYDGMLRVARHIEALITALDGKGRLAFTRTQDADSASTPRFKVTMGVVPDYMYDGKGMRIDGVSDGKPAAIAGLKAGDVVVHIGELEVADMMGYMKALGQFKKGDTATVTVLREGREMKVDVTF